ncbi:MAG: EI24 domain-containing protein [Nannocystaceae bacterium]
MHESIQARASTVASTGTGLWAGGSAAVRGLRRALASEGVRRTYVQLLLALWVLSLVLVAGLVTVLWLLTPIAPDASLWATIGLWATRIAGALMLALVGPVLALFAVNIIFPMLSERVFFAGMRELDPERAAALEEAEGMSVTRSIKMSVARMLYFLGWTLLAFVLALIPVIGALLGPAVQFWMTARIMTWELLDPVFDKRDMDLHAQRGFLRRNGASMVGFGLPYGFLMSLPLVGPLFFGLAQAAVASLYVEVLAPRGEDLALESGGR